MSSFSYKVLKKGYWGGCLYAPNTIRHTVVSDVKLKPVPSWLAPISDGVTDLTPAQKAAATKKANKEAAEAAKIAENDSASTQDQVNFMNNTSNVGPADGEIVTL